MQTLNALDDEFAALIGDGGTKVVGLGVIAFKGGREVYSFFGGRRHLAPDKPLTRKTLLRAASVSKMFTAFALMQLVERGTITLRDDVSKHLGFELRNPNFLDTPITIEMLASHTSSLRDGIVYALPPACRLKEFFTADGAAYENGAHFAPATEPPGKFFRYSNLNYGILGTVIERVSGERFDLYQKNHLFKQTGIGGDYVVGNLDADAFAKLGTLYQRQGDTWRATLDDYNLQPRRDMIDIQNTCAPKAYGSYSLAAYEVGTNATALSPQGGLRLSFDDLSRCLELLINRGKFRGKRIIGEESFDEMFRAHWVFDADNLNGETYGGVMENYGLGTYRLGGESKARPCKDYAIDLVGHGGEAFGIISGVYLVPGTRDGFAFMANGAAISLDADESIFGKYSANYIWEEAVMNPVCRHIFK